MTQMNGNSGSLPEIIFDTDTSFTPEAVEQLVKQGQVRKLGPKLYTSMLDASPESIIHRHVFAIAGHFWPGAVLGWRTAFEEAPAPDGAVYLSYHIARKVALPGYTLNLVKGPNPLAGDRPYTHSLHLASPARAFLENLTAARHYAHRDRALPAEALEERLRAIHDPADRERLLNRARELAPQYDWDEALKSLEALLEKTDETAAGRRVRPRVHHVSDRSAKLRSSLSQLGDALARRGASKLQAAGETGDKDVDRERLRLFQNLFRVLRERAYHARPRGEHTPAWDSNRAFFEAYFSNYIAGTEFDLEAAHQIIIAGQPLAARPMDSTVLLNTFHLVSAGADFNQRPDNGAAFLELLAHRHERLFANIDSRAAGSFRQPGEATDHTRFIAPEYVRGTLLRGFELYSELQEPFTRAAFMLVLVRECHPFESGSGRVARMMMNAELSAADELRILIPPVYCGDYWSGLRALTQQNDPEPLVRMLGRAHTFRAAIDFDAYETALRQLNDCNAFMPPDKRLCMHEV